MNTHIMPRVQAVVYLSRHWKYSEEFCKVIHEPAAHHHG
ncbi:MAG: hypothetical protein AVDCRST_MAG93-9742 [uncultured Chloroflexia bacterium]|uniref:Uncharacterized protein n=1 Tax=uncultured Chloroflexia bacterium TaxID=1672391 RepID=A0A6J4NLH2_9CHLR|nr:MAG: hypothetical protein AVDCRST_MAG93-9742 [uncultured Chloroflexia bacterium]